MRAKLSFCMLLICSFSFAQDYAVDFDQVNWNLNGSRVIQSGNEITIQQSAAPYESQEVSYTLTVDPNMSNLYFMLNLYFEDVAQGPGDYDIPKLRIESTSGAKLVNNNYYSVVDREWIYTGVKLDNFKNMGLSQVVLKFTYQNARGTVKLKDAFVSSTPGVGQYSFPYAIPTDPSVTLDVNTGAYHRFNDDLLSTNCHFTWAPKNWEDESVQEMIYKKFPMQNLRFPGGTVANFYSWETDDFYDNRFSDNNNTASSGAKDAKKFGYSGYADVAKTLGGSSTLLFNVFTDDKATSQARLQARLNDGLNIKWIELGNENYFGDQAYGYVDDTELGLNGNGDGEDYDEYIRHTKNLASWLREVKPDIKVVVNTHDDHWNTPLAAEDYYDACVVHNYNFVNGFMLEQFSIRQLMQSYKKTESTISKHVSTFGDKPIIMSEWGLLSDMPNSFIQVLCTADNFFAIEKGGHQGIVAQAGIHMLYHGDFVGEGSLISNLGDGLKLNPVGVAYSKLFDVFMGNKVYDAYSTSAELESDLDAVHAKAIDLGDSVYVFVVNKLPVTSPLNLSFNGQAYNGAFTLETYTENMDNRLTMNYGIDENPWVKSAGTGAIGIPANSIAVVTIQKSEFESICNTPQLGGNTNLCGRTAVTLNSNVSSVNKTHKWYKDGVEIPNAKEPMYTVTTKGVYKVVTDSVGCIREDEVVVDDKLPPIYLGKDIEFCTTTMKTLDAVVNNPSVNYKWSVDGNDITETSGLLTVYNAGVYEVVVSAGACATVSDQIAISTQLIDVSFDTICASGKAHLSVNETGAYAWFASAEGGDVLTTNLVYEPSITQSATYYVQDNNVETYNFGLTAKTGTTYGGTTDYTIWGRPMYMNAYTGFTLETVDIFTNSVVDLVITISGAEGTFVYTENGIPKTDNTPYTLNMNQYIPKGEYSISFVGTNGKVWVQVSDKSNAEVPGVVEYGGVDGGNHYGLLYNWNISIAGECARTPVVAVIDNQHADCLITEITATDLTKGSVYPNPTTGTVFLSEEAAYIVYDMMGTALFEGKGNLIDLTHLVNGMYLLQVGNEMKKIIKQ